MLSKPTNQLSILNKQKNVVNGNGNSDSDDNDRIVDNVTNNVADNNMHHEKYTNVVKPAQPQTRSSLMNFLTVTLSNKSHKINTTSDKFMNYLTICAKYGFLVAVLTLNFLGLSVSLNCNRDEEFVKRIFSAIFAFFFGFVYLIVNYYTYRVIFQGKLCRMDRTKLFPFPT